MEDQNIDYNDGNGYQPDDSQKECLALKNTEGSASVYNVSNPKKANLQPRLANRNVLPYPNLTDLIS